jgi:hypothetical protein
VKSCFVLKTSATVRQRGRKSAADLAFPNVNGEPPRVDPPPHLSEPERSCFEEITRSCSPRHFVPSDAPLLVLYVQAFVLAQSAIKDAATDDAALARWERAARVCATLATRLRLAPQARLDAKSTARMQPSQLRAPWEIERRELLP